MLGVRADLTLSPKGFRTGFQTVSVLAAIKQEEISGARLRMNNV